MSTEKHDSVTSETEKNEKKTVSRRNFVKGAATAAALAAAVPLEPLLGGKESQAEASVINFNASKRAQQSLNYRVNTAKAENIDVGVPGDNGDSTRFPDLSGNFTKALKHDSITVTNPAAVQSYLKALTSGEFEDFENIIVGTPGGGANSLFNGPQGAFALDLEGLDSHATTTPVAPGVTTNITAAEQVEHYWAALLRDVDFADYPNNPIVAEAVKDMNNLSFVKSSANFEFPFPVTPQNLFRGQVVPGDGNVMGPYVSQFMIQPTMLGAQPISQQLQVFLPNQSFMTTNEEFALIQNGGNSGRELQFDPIPRFIRRGRDLSSFTHVDVLFQAYFTAFLVLGTMNTPMNPGNPYIGSVTEKPFGTLGAPDAAGTLAEMATRALKGVWFHKWLTDLRLRPEEFGGLVQANKTNIQPQGKAAAFLHPDVLNSAVLPIIHKQFGSFLLPQAFPEGSPTHPCYPTGHGTVAGACITAIKFFFDGTQKIRPLLQAIGRDVMMPSEDGLSLVPYTGSDRDELTINGELLKLAFNVTIGHGILSGIHFRSSSLSSVLLGEQIGLSVLQDRANGYNEPFTIRLTTVNGTETTISNIPATGTQRHNLLKKSNGKLA